MAKIQSASVPGKETIYVDVDDEITSIIDKVQNAKGKVVALVLPKRATVLQSVVNMKLLKRTAENANKNLVLVTTEAGLMPLAGSVGLHVADTPTSKPSIPPAPISQSDEPENIDEPLDIVDSTAAGADFDPQSAAEKPVGELAAAGAASKVAEDDIDEDIDLSDDGETPLAAAGAPKTKKNKKLKIPNFDSFRKRLLLGCLIVVVIIVAWILAVVVLPKATVTIHTDSSTIVSNLSLTLDTATKKLDAVDDVVPATSQSQQKTDTQTVPATGQQNNGKQATGSVKFSVTKCTQPILAPPANLSTGSSVSGGGNTYILQELVTFTYDHPTNGGNCAVYESNAADITALNGGTSSNTNGTIDFKASNGDTGSGSADGGTDDIIKVVAQADIDGATSKIKAADTGSVKQQLVSGLQAKGLMAVPSTFLAGDPQVTTSAKAGDQADSVTVTAVTTYTMLGVQKSDLQALVDANVKNQLDKGKQVILDDGVANAVFSQATPGTATSASVAMHTKSLAGPQISIPELKKQLAGKKSGDIQSLIKQTPGVTSVDVHFSPFWVNTVPKNTAKLTIQIDKSGKQ